MNMDGWSPRKSGGVSCLFCDRSIRIGNDCYAKSCVGASENTEWDFCCVECYEKMTIRPNIRIEDRLTIGEIKEVNESLADLKAGRFKKFNNLDDFFKDLDSE